MTRAVRAVVLALAAAFLAGRLGFVAPPEYVGRLGFGGAVIASGQIEEVRVVHPADALYVCIQDDAKIAIIDMRAKHVVRTIDLTKLGFPATAKPHYVVVEPDASHWYVSLIGANQVVKFDLQDRIVGRFEMETPGMLALAPPDRLVISRSMSAVNPPKRIAVVRRTTMQGDELDVLFPRPHPVATTGAYAYTGSLGVNQIASVAFADDRVEVTGVAGPTHSLVQFATTRDGKTLVGTAEISGQLLVFDLAEPAKPRLIKTIDVGKMAFDPTFTPDETAVWVPIKSTNEIVILSTKNWAEIGRVRHDSLKQPHQIVFSPDGLTAFVTNNNKMDHMGDPAHAGHATGDGMAALAIVNVARRQVDQSIELGKNLTGMGARARK
jgi:DNA-binding beta-propeller fold protein YncE